MCFPTGLVTSEAGLQPFFHSTSLSLRMAATTNPLSEPHLSRPSQPNRQNATLSRTDFEFRPARARPLSTMQSSQNRHFRCSSLHIMTAISSHSSTRFHTTGSWRIRYLTGNNNNADLVHAKWLRRCCFDQRSTKENRHMHTHDTTHVHNTHTDLIYARIFGP